MLTFILDFFYSIKTQRIVMGSDTKVLHVLFLTDEYLMHSKTAINSCNNTWVVTFLNTIPYTKKKYTNIIFTCRTCYISVLHIVQK